MDFDFESLVGKFAPLIGTAIGGPFGGMAAKIALDALGIDTKEGDEKEQLKEALKSMTPEQAIQLKLAEKNWEAKMKELDIKEEELHGRDRASARDMATKTSIWPQVTLSTLYTVGYFSVLYMFLSGGVSIEDSIKTEFAMVLGVLTAGQVQIMNFWFGSSSGSKDKTTKLSLPR